MATVTIWGRLGKDPETKSINNGKSVTEFTVAVNQTGKEQTTAWYRVSLFDKAGENAANLLRKGSGIFVSGTLRLDEWTDREGNKRTTPSIDRVTEWQLTDKKEDRKPVGVGANDDEMPF